MFNTKYKNSTAKHIRNNVTIAVIYLNVIGTIKNVMKV